MRKLLKRWRREKAVRLHLAEHGGVFHFDGRPIAVPADLVLGIQFGIVKGGYEARELTQIDRYLPVDLPVIELGGCLGLVSAHIAGRLAEGVPHLVVEANPALVDICRRNATHDGRRAATEVVHGAVAYGGPTIRFAIAPNVHASRLAEGDSTAGVEVAACRLSELVARIGGGAGYALVCDIEGAEYEMFERDGPALAGCRMAIVEVHANVFAERGQSIEGFLALAAAAGLRVVETADSVITFARDADTSAKGGGPAA